jgi:hypothetical protein
MLRKYTSILLTLASVQVNLINAFFTSLAYPLDYQC